MEGSGEGRRKLPRASKQQTTRARKQRQEMLSPELCLWQRLRPKYNKDFHFRRQAPLIGRFIVDFYFSDKRIAFEIDGTVHELHRERDAARDQALSAAGITVVRISARRVLANPDGVANLIRSICLGEVDVQDIE
ncbi:MAG: DUF559 domain-containing protein [Armatimonadetes bacterium]|nr:DUF559 domain-containing protein [Armatimonadota bacterium]